MLLTLGSSFFALLAILIYKRASKKITNIAFFVVSLSFFLFAFHVHEKTILLPFLAYLIAYKELRLILPSFALISMYSLHPLLIREQQILTYAILSPFYFIMSKYANSYYTQYVTGKSGTIHEARDDNPKLRLLFNVLDILNVIAVVGYHICEILVPPPKDFPWMYPMINAALSFGNFVIFYLYANYRIYQLIVNDKEKVKTD